MRNPAAAIPLFAFALASNLLITGCSGTAIATVSPSTISQLPAGQSFEIDLTRSGTVYKFNGPSIDFGRVSIRTSEGVRNFGETLKATNTSLEGEILLGTPGDMRDYLPVKTGEAEKADCGPVACKCENKKQCDDMVKNGECTDTWCSSATGTCYCTPKASSATR